MTTPGACPSSVPPRRRAIYFFAGILLLLIGWLWLGSAAAGSALPAASAAAGSALPAASAAPPRVPAVCTSGWSIVTSPNVGGLDNELWGVSASTPGNAWAVGNAHFDSLTENWNGTQWQVGASPTPDAAELSILAGVAGQAPDDLWAAGYMITAQHVTVTRIEHWNGTNWGVVSSPNPTGATSSELEGVAVVSPTDVWAAGSAVTTLRAPLFEHWNGSQWSIVPAPGAGGLHAIAARASNDIWAVGMAGLLEHWNGSAWSLVTSPTSHDLYGVAAMASDDAWAAGDTGIVLHWNGSTWQVVAGPAMGSFGGRIAAIAALAANDVWAAGWTCADGNCIGEHALLAHWDGAAWSVVADPVPPGSSLLHAITSVSANDLWAVGAYTSGTIKQTLIEHYTGPCVSPTPGHGATQTLTPVPTRTPTLPPGATMTATPTLPPCVPGQYSDVHSTDYFYIPVQYLVGHGIVSGYADCTFRPYSTTTRGQMVKIVTLGFAVPAYTPPGGDHTFADVPTTHPFFAYIEAAAHAGVVSGYGCGGVGEPCDAQHRPYFRPVVYVTRGQLAKIVVSAAGWPLLNPATGTFEDVAPGSAFFSFVETAVCRAIVSGYACGGPGEPCDTQHRPYYRPATTATRGQIAKIAYAALTGSAICPPR